MKKLLTTFFLMFSLALLFSEEKNALLIANGNYKSFSSLATPVKEARDLKASLEKLGFKVTIVENASKMKMEDSILDFEEVLSKSKGIGFFHYGGHAVQVNGKNYLIPVDADISDERRVSSRAVVIDEIMNSMCADSNIVILDACRNNPLPAGSGRSATRGLSLVDTKPESSSIIVYSAQSGKVAQDGLFTPILTKKILENKSFTDILMEVRNEVKQKSNGEQSPAEYNELLAPIYLAGFTSPKTEIVTNNVNNTKVNGNIDYYKVGVEFYDKKDYVNAVKNFEIAANQGNSDAQNNLGICYHVGQGVPQNYSKAVEWFTKAAEQGDSYAQYALGVCYENGRGVPQNYSKAVEWYTKAAEQGFNKAQYNLGCCYYNGQGVPQNYSKAVEWFTKAANQGYSDAQYNLGVCYKNGRGVPQNQSKAIKWYTKAANQGNNDAKAALKRLGR